MFRIKKLEVPAFCTRVFDNFCQVPIWVLNVGYEGSLRFAGA